MLIRSIGFQLPSTLLVPLRNPGLVMSIVALDQRISRLMRDFYPDSNTCLVRSHLYLVCCTQIARSSSFGAIKPPYEIFDPVVQRS